MTELAAMPDDVERVKKALEYVYTFIFDGYGNSVAARAVLNDAIEAARRLAAPKGGASISGPAVYGSLEDLPGGADGLCAPQGDVPREPIFGPREPKFDLRKISDEILADDLRQRLQRAEAERAQGITSPRHEFYDDVVRLLAMTTAPQAAPSADEREIQQGIIDAEALVGAQAYHHPDTIEMARLALRLYRKRAAPDVAAQGDVPREPTPAMLAAGRPYAASGEDGNYLDEETARAFWRAMWDAAPPSRHMAAIQKYGRHLDWCDSERLYRRSENAEKPRQCNCGFEEASRGRLTAEWEAEDIALIRQSFAQELVAWCEKRAAGWRLHTDDLDAVIAEIRRLAALPKGQEDEGESR